MGRGLLGLVVLLGAASVTAAKPIAIDGSLDGEPIKGTVERVRQADGTYLVQARLDNGMTGQGTRLAKGLWKITVRRAAQPNGKAVGLRGKISGEDGQAGTPVDAKPLTLILVKRGKSVRATLQRDGKSVGDLSRSSDAATKTEQPPETVRFADFDQRLGSPAKATTKNKTPPPAAFDRDADVAVMEKVLQDTIQQMNARGQRFDHPIPFLSGLWGNTLYRYQKTGKFTDAPFGALFDRLYNANGRYRNVKECYDQAETVLAALKKKLPNLTSDWELGIASQPGHYWAVARIDLSKQPGAGQGYMFVHMDPWKDSFDVEYGDASSVDWTAR